MIGGVLVTALGIWLLSQMNAHTPRWDLAWRMLVLGVGLGPGQSLFALAVQNAMPISRLGVVTSSSQFFRQIGSTIGVALFGALLTHRLANEGQGFDLGALQGLALKATAPDGAGGAARHADPALAQALTHAITGVFAAGLIVIAAGLVTILLIPELPLRSRQPGPQGEAV